MGLQKALKKKGASAKQAEPKTTKTKTHEEVVAGNSAVNKAITGYHKATQAVVNAEAMLNEAKKTIIDYGMTRMFERQNTQNITLNGKEGDVYIALKDQYTVKVNPETEKCDELEEFLKSKNVDPATVVSYEEKATFNIKKMSEAEVEKLSDLLAETFGQERMNEILEFKTSPVIKGLVDLFPVLCKTREEWTKLSALACQHTPTVNIPSKKGKK